MIIEHTTIRTLITMLKKLITITAIFALLLCGTIYLVFANLKSVVAVTTEQSSSSTSTSTSTSTSSSLQSLHHHRHHHHRHHPHHPHHPHRHHQRRSSPSVADDFARAFEHGARVRAQGSCRLPHPTIIYVNATDPSKVFMPRATVLHRCGDHTGCCLHANERCDAIEMQSVQLYFITIKMHMENLAPAADDIVRTHPHRNRNRRMRQTPSVEKIFFTNHTRCGCRLRNSSNVLNNASIVAGYGLSSNNQDNDDDPEK